MGRELEHVEPEPLNYFIIRRIFWIIVFVKRARYFIAHALS